MVGVMMWWSMMEQNQKDKIGNTPLGEALIRVEKVLDEATKPDTLLDILKQIRTTETSQTEWVPGYAGAWRFKVIDI